jgi:nucleolin
LDYESAPAAEETVEAPAEESAPRSPSPEEGSKLYIGNLPWSCNSQILAEVLQDVGEVELVEVIYDRDTGRSKGYAFATMSSNKDAQEAIAKLDGYEMEGRALKVNFPQSNREPRTNNFRSERPPRTEGGYGGGSRGGSYNNPNKLFVGNLAWSVDDSSLGQLFSDYGNVLDAKVVHDRDSGRSRGFGFVTFEKASEVNEAIEKLDGADYDGRQLRVNLAGDKPQPPRSF